MKKSTSLLLSALVALGILSTAASADIKKGQKAYLKQCKKCHGNSTKGAAMKRQDEWEEAFEDDAAVFIEWHEGEEKGKKYANSKKFKKSAPHLKDFLYEYANDSGNVPSCG
ncbi:MAG: cytochrome C [Campylobacterota bacterium]|nr:cytochrome C [Campylobacterota bacterium]